MTLTIDQEAPPLRIDATNVVRIANTRVTLDSVIAAFLDGASPESIAESYSSVTLSEVYATIAYYLRHKQKVDAYLAQRERRAEEMRREIQSRPDYQQRRERLIARAKAQGLRE